MFPQAVHSTRDSIPPQKHQQYLTVTNTITQIKFICSFGIYGWSETALDRLEGYAWLCGVNTWTEPPWQFRLGCEAHAWCVRYLKVVPHCSPRDEGKKLMPASIPTEETFLNFPNPVCENGWFKMIVRYAL